MKFRKLYSAVLGCAIPCLIANLTQAQSLGWNKTQIINELKSNYDVKSYQVKNDNYQQEYIEVTYKSNDAFTGYYFQNGVVTQINIVTDKQGADTMKKDFNNRWTKTSSNSWEGLLKGTKFYMKTFKVKTEYLVVFSYYPLNDNPVSNGMAAEPY